MTELSSLRDELYQPLENFEPVYTNYPTELEEILIEEEMPPCLKNQQNSLNNPNDITNPTNYAPELMEVMESLENMTEPEYEALNTIIPSDT